MKKISADVLPVSALTEQEVQSFSEWVTSIDNSFDPGITAYPRLVMSRALADDVPFAYVPLHPVLVCESLAPQPGTPVLQMARGLQALGEAVDQVGQMAGFGESYFITNSEPEMALCERRGWKAILHDPERKMWLLKRVLPRPDFQKP